MKYKRKAHNQEDYLKVPINTDAFLNASLPKEALQACRSLFTDYNSRQNARCYIEQTVALLNSMETPLEAQRIDDALLTQAPNERETLINLLVENLATKRSIIEQAWSKAMGCL